MPPASTITETSPEQWRDALTTQMTPKTTTSLADFTVTVLHCTKDGMFIVWHDSIHVPSRNLGVEARRSRVQGHPNPQRELEPEKTLPPKSKNKQQWDSVSVSDASSEDWSSRKTCFICALRVGNKLNGWGCSLVRGCSSVRVRAYHALKPSQLNPCTNWECWRTPLITALGSQRKESQKFKVMHNSGQRGLLKTMPQKQTNKQAKNPKVKTKNKETELNPNSCVGNETVLSLTDAWYQLFIIYYYRMETRRSHSLSILSFCNMQLCKGNKRKQKL